MYATSILNINAFTFYLIKMLELMWWLTMLFIPPFALLMAVMNIKKKINKSEKKKWAFFHPFCNDGGGGEKVLWCMIKQLTQKTSDQIVVYSLEADKEIILQKVESRFGIVIRGESFSIVHVSGKRLLTSKGFLTMILHIVLPMLYALKCLWKYQPDIFYDTTGYASVLVLVKLLLPSTQTAAYVHYPFISQEMIEKVREQRVDFNNSALISKSPLLSKAKLYYYIFVLKVYKLIGKTVDFAQTNSSWTHGHMSKLWSQLAKKGMLTKLYPPCTVSPLLKIAKPNPTKQIQMMSLAQFRPEKQQQLQLQVFSELLKLNLNKKLMLKMCGTTRGPEDESILQNLKKIAKDLKIEDNVQFVVNQPYSKIMDCFKECFIGIHTMQAEHFGISIVEMLAAGLIVVAHNSAGPKLDIIRDHRYLAVSKQDYILKLKQILQKQEEVLQRISADNRNKAMGFSEEEFQSMFLRTVEERNKED